MNGSHCRQSWCAGAGSRMVVIPRDFAKRSACSTASNGLSSWHSKTQPEPNLSRPDLTIAGLSAALAPGETTIEFCPSSATSMVATILVADDGQNSIVVSPGANAALSPAMVRSGLERFGSGCVLLCQLESPFDAVEQALRFAKSRGMTTILDPAPAHQDCLQWLPFIDYLTPNETEAALLAGLASPIATDADARRAAAQLRQQGAKSVLLKLGRRGCFIATAETAELVPAFEVKAVDTTAAGDCFNGAFSVALVEGLPIIEAVRFANAAAALSVTRRGAQSSLPSRGEVDTLHRGTTR